MELACELFAPDAIKAVQQKVTKERENGTLQRAPGYGVNLSVNSSPYSFSKICKELIAVCQDLRTTGSWEQADLSYVAQISVSDIEVDEQDFKFLTALISALKASSISSLNLTNCGLTSEVAGLLFFQLFSTPVYWTRLDVSHNRNFCLPESRFALDCFNYVVRRNPLRVLNFDHTGFTNADIQGLLRILLMNASSIKHLQILKIGPPGSEYKNSGSQDARAEQLDASAAEQLCKLLTSHQSLQLLEVWGAEGELADSIMQAALQAGLERDESETEYLRLKRMGILEGDEHFREFDPNVLQPVMDAQMEAPEEMEVRPEDSPMHRYGDLGRDAVQHDQPRGFACAISNTAGPQPLGRIRERGAHRTSHRHEKRRRRPSNRGAGAGQAPGLPRKRHRQGPIAEHAGGHSWPALPNTAARMAACSGPGWEEPRSPASCSFGEDLDSSDTGDSADSAEYSPRAHEELLHTRLEVREISGGSPDSNGADARLDSPARSLLSPAAAASPLVLSPAARTKGAAIAARQPQKPRRATVNDGSPRNAPRRKSREPPSTPVPEGLEAFGWESRESAEKHPPKGVFEKPKEPKRARKRLPQTEEALRRLLEQRAGRHAGSHANDASDSPHSQSNGNEPSDAERSDHEVVVEARAGRRLHILESEDQELANVAVLDSRELAGSDRVGEPAEQMHVHDAHEPPEASPAYHSLGSQQQHSMDDVRDSPKATYRRRSSGTAAASSSDQSASAAGQPGETDDAASGGPGSPSEDAAPPSEASQQNLPLKDPLQMPLPVAGNVAANGKVDQQAAEEVDLASSPEHEASPDRRDPAGERGSAEAASPSALQGEPPRVGEMNARTRRELAALMPFSWDRLADRHPANTERMGVSLVENMGSRRRARASANREEDPGSSDEEEPEDNVPLAKLLTVPASQHGAATTSKTAQETPSGMASAHANLQPSAIENAQMPTPLQSRSDAAAEDRGVAGWGCKHVRNPRNRPPVSERSVFAALNRAQDQVSTYSGEREAEQCGPVTGAEALDNEATAPDGEDQMYDNEMCDIVPDSEDEDATG